MELELKHWESLNFFLKHPVLPIVYSKLLRISTDQVKKIIEVDIRLYSIFIHWGLVTYRLQKS